MPEQQHTIDEVLEALGIFSNYTKARFDKIEETMVTRDYLDEVAVNLRSGAGLALRKEDHKVSSLVGLLKNKAIISSEEADSINALEPFPKAL